jgi:2-C-methyl-D-erythritol 2,4-cyclodiphosphate synthase
MGYPLAMTRVGFGYDSHRFVAGRPLVLGGVRVEHSAGLAGHSDADAVLHAITDAVLGALGAGDIGEHFPDTDPRWRGADSAVFLRQAVDLAGKAGLRVGNCDVTVLCESPRLSPYKAAITARIAELLGVEAGQVSVKAKTNEGMGWVGHGEGLAAFAVVLLKERLEVRGERLERVSRHRRRTSGLAARKSRGSKGKRSES